MAGVSASEARTEPTAGSSSSAGGTSFYGDHAPSDDLLTEAPRRLRVASLIIAAAAVMVWVAGKPAWQPPDRFPMLDFSVAAIVLASAAIFVLCLVLRARAQMLYDLGLVYEFVCCLAISLAEQFLPYGEGHLVRGISWTALVLTFFPLTVPSTPGKALCASVAGASMGPVGLLVAIAAGNPVPPLTIWIYLFVPTYIAAFIGWTAASMLHRLNRRIKEGRQLGSYQLEELLGRGGIGEVWRARHRFLARPAAIKLVRQDSVSRNNAENAVTTLRRFEREAQATSALRSPNTITLYDFGIARDGTFYYVMELLDGLDLETLVRQHGPLPAPRVVHLLDQVCQSLAEAHAQGLIHRDIKPANIYLCRLGLTHDVVKVLDFGLVATAASADDGRITSTGCLSGTPAYMAPEMASDGHAVDARADIYSLGCVAYWLLSGTRVFEDAAPLQVMLAHLQAVPPPLGKRTDRPLPAALEAIVMACLEKDPRRRPQTTLELRERLSGVPLERWSPQEAQDWWARVGAAATASPAA
jgi:serine/threonine-protein kinase